MKSLVATAGGTTYNVIAFVAPGFAGLGFCSRRKMATWTPNLAV